MVKSEHKAFKPIVVRPEIQSKYNKTMQRKNTFRLRYSTLVSVFNYFTLI